MANNITSHPRLWSLDTAAAVKAAGNEIRVKHALYLPNAAADDVVISEYGRDGSTAENVFRMKAKPGAADPIDRDFVPPLSMNGMLVSTIDGGTLYLEIESVNTKS